jgi:hypothetical protein
VQHFYGVLLVPDIAEAKCHHGVVELLIKRLLRPTVIRSTALSKLPIAFSIFGFGHFSKDSDFYYSASRRKQEQTYCHFPENAIVFSSGKPLFIIKELNDGQGINGFPH